LWSRDKVTKNTIKIAEDAGKMYDKFADFTRDMERVSKALSAAEKAHSDAVRKLSGGTGNLVKRAEDLRALGIKANKQLAASMLSNDDDEQLSISEGVSQV
ncbi:MAG: DNA recombination protein RmuC, partial [Duncaniella sp.]|nr:DNA recombination protein RmuC [Duncaniella sp.]